MGLRVGEVVGGVGWLWVVGEIRYDVLWSFCSHVVVAGLCSLDVCSLLVCSCVVGFSSLLSQRFVEVERW